MALRSPSTMSGTRTLPVMSRMISRFTSAPPEARGQDADALLVELRHPLHRLGAGGRPAHVDLMRAIDHEAHELPAMKHGRRNEEVRQVPRAHEEVVEDDGIPRLHGRGGVLAHHVADDGGHGAQVAGTEVALGDHLATGVEERGGEVAPLAHRLRVRGLAEGRPRLVGDGLERRPDYAARDGVDASGGHAHAEPPISMIRFPWPSTVAWSSGRRITVVSRSSITAGPVTKTPRARR